MAGHEEDGSLQLIEEGLEGLPSRIALYVRNYIDKVDCLDERIKALVEAHRST